MDDEERPAGRLFVRYLPRGILILVLLLLAAGITRAAYLRYAKGQDWAEWTQFGDYTTTITSRTTTRDAQAGAKEITSISETTVMETHRGKTLWDLLDLLVVPVTLALLAVFFNWRQNLNQNRIAQDNLCEAEYQKYLDELRSLLLERSLARSREDSDARKLARAYTLTIFRNLDPGRKGSLLQFLNEAELITSDSPVISLAMVNLERIDLSGADLNGVNLSEARLNGANLSRAYLTQANLQKASLKNANLRGAYLEQARLTESDLSGADLEGAFFPQAVLSGANLSRARLNHCSLNEANLEYAIVSDEQLAQARSLKDAVLPGGRTNPVDRLDTREKR